MFDASQFTPAQLRAIREIGGRSVDRHNFHPVVFRGLIQRGAVERVGISGWVGRRNFIPYRLTPEAAAWAREQEQSDD